MARFEGKAALVTGAGSGIGRATAIALAAEGANVVLADYNFAAVEHLAGELGARTSPFKVDVADKDQVNAMVAHTVETFGAIDCAFNNAGVGGVHKPIFDIEYDEWDRTLSIDLSSVFYCIKAEAREMRGRGGSIVNTASVAGLVATPMLTDYAAAKHGVVGLTKAAALDLISHGIRVNAVSPGGINTPMLQRALAKPELEARLKAITPIGRIAAPEEVAQTVLFLLSSDASYLVGQAIAVDGGISAQ